MVDTTKGLVLYLSYDGLTDPLGQSQILPYVIGLSKLEWKFTIISFEKPENLKNNRNELENICRNNSIQWIPLVYHKSPSIFSTIYDLWMLTWGVSKIVRKNPGCLIHCRSYITALVALRMKKKFGSKFIFDMRGFWADERVEGGLWNLKNPIYKLIYYYFKRREKDFLVYADHTISLTESAKKEILSWSLKMAAITVIPTCVDLELFNPTKIKKPDQEALRTLLGIKPEDFVLLYLGSWGTWYLTKEMLNFFSRLKTVIPTAKFLIVTSDRVDLTGSQYRSDIRVCMADRKSVPLYISIAALGIVFIKPSYSKKASSATKLAEFLAMGIPVISNKGWGDIEYLDFGDQLQLVDLGFDPPKEWLQTLKSFKPDLSQISLAHGIKLYNMVYQNHIQVD